MTFLPVSCVHKHAILSKCKLQAYYLNCSCCARPLRSSCKSMDCVAAEPGRGGAGRTDLKSVERPFLLIWLNHWRQMQPIQNSGNLWILRWALTYITMTSKHNFRGHIFRLFLLPLLFLSLLCPRLTRYCCCWCWGFPPPLPPTPAAWKRHVCANKIN